MVWDISRGSFFKGTSAYTFLKFIIINFFFKRNFAAELQTETICSLFVIKFLLLGTFAELPLEKSIQNVLNRIIENECRLDLHLCGICLW